MAFDSCLELFEFLFQMLYTVLKSLLNLCFLEQNRIGLDVIYVLYLELHLVEVSELRMFYSLHNGQFFVDFDLNTKQQQLSYFHFVFFPCVNHTEKNSFVPNLSSYLVTPL